MQWPITPHEDYNKTLWARRFEDEGNVRNAISIWIINVLLEFS